MAWTFGIDFGTCFTTVAGRRDGAWPRLVDLEANKRGAARRMMASLVFVGDDQWHVGEEAAQRGRARPRRLVRAPKLALGTGFGANSGGLWTIVDDDLDCELPVVRLCGTIIRAAYERACRTVGEEPDVVRVTHPAVWADEPSRIRSLRDAIREAGIDGAALASEPEAAALGAVALDLSAPLGARTLVYDLGGGTCDVAVLSRTKTGVQVEHAAGREDVGGEEFDRRLLAHVAEEVLQRSSAWARALDADAPSGQRDGAAQRVFAQRALEETIAAKEQLADEDAATIFLDWPDSEDEPAGRMEIALDRRILARCIAGCVKETVAIVEEALQAAGISAADLATVVLTGGSSRLPLVTDALRELLGESVTLNRQDKDAVALGATLDWEARMEVRRDLLVPDPNKSPFSCYPRPIRPAQAWEQRS